MYRKWGDNSLSTQGSLPASSPGMWGIIIIKTNLKNALKCHFLNKTLLTYNFRTLRSRYFRPPLLKTGSRWARDFRAADRIVTSNLQRVFLAFCVFLAHLEEMSSISEEEFSEFTSGDWRIQTLLRIFRWAYWFYNSRLCAIWRKFGANCDWKRSCRICRGSRISRRRRADAFKSVF